MKRTPLERKTPLTATTGLTRRTPLEGGSGLSRERGLARRPAEPGSASTLNARHRDTGPDDLTRETVYIRDGWCCTCCGQSVIGRPHSVGHRMRRSQGGSNETSNLLTFLGDGTGRFDDDHHRRIDMRRDPRDEERGLTVRSWLDPAEIPVLVTTPDGTQALMFLTDDGEYTTEPPKAVAA